MNVAPLSDRGSAAVRDALLSHGWEGDVCLVTAHGMRSAGFHVTGIDAQVIEALVPVAGKLGLEIISGDDWVIITGARSRLGAFARPWMQPDALRDLATAIGMAMPGEQRASWRHARGSVSLDHPVIVGVINVTPDSFSDGGRAFTVADALMLAETLLDGGAQVIDVGGESTRPGATALGVAEEQERVLPVIAALATKYPDIPVSVDTVHAVTARAALDAGASIVNDVTAGRHEPELIDVVARAKAGVVLSHSRGPLGRLASYDDSEYAGDVVGVVGRELAAAAAAAVERGVDPASVVIDPGFGFGKTAEQSIVLLQQLDAITALGWPVLVGPSRKRFLGHATGRPIEDRDRATAAACAFAYERGARLFRVHDPAAVRDALAMAHALEITPQ